MRGPGRGAKEKAGVLATSEEPRRWKGRKIIERREVKHGQNWLVCVSLCQLPHKLDSGFARRSLILIPSIIIGGYLYQHPL